MTSYWEAVPFDILTSILPYLDLENWNTVVALNHDNCIRSRLEFDDPCGFLWKYLFTRKLSRIIQYNSRRYYEYAQMKTAKREDLETLLYWAAEQGYEIMAQYLIEKGASGLNSNYSALIIAAQYGHLHLIKYFVEHGADIHVSCGCALTLAASRGHFDTVKYLVECGAANHKRVIIPKGLEFNTSELTTIGKFRADTARNFSILRTQRLDFVTNKAIQGAIDNGYYEIARYLTDYIITLYSSD